MQTPLLLLFPFALALSLPSPTPVLTFPHINPDSHSPINRRTPSRHLMACPPYHTFIESHCQPETPQSYSILCYDQTPHDALLHQPTPLPWVFVDGQCAPSEICVDGRRSEGQEAMAWCVSMDNFVKILERRVAGEQKAQVQVPWYEDPRYRYPGKGWKGQEVQAVLTGMGGREWVVAERMAMVGRNDVPVRDNGDAGKVGGTQECRNCTGMRLKGIMEGVVKVELDVELGMGAGVALLWVLVGGVLS